MINKGGQVHKLKRIEVNLFTNLFQVRAEISNKEKEDEDAMETAVTQTK